jgi:AcrR family transcriptional regulator
MSILTFDDDFSIASSLPEQVGGEKREDAKEKREETKPDEMRNDARQRVKILAAAGQLFMEFGPSRVKMEEIAEKVAVSKKTLYKHFSGKDDVLSCFISATQSEIQGLIDQFIEIIAAARDDDDFMRGVAATIERLSDRVAAMWRSPFMKDIERAYPQLWQEFTEQRRANILRTVKIICNEAKNRGILRGDINYDLFTLMYLHCVENIMHPRLGSELSMTAQQIFNMLMTILFGGVLTPKGRELGERFGTIRMDASEGN